MPRAGGARKGTPGKGYANRTDLTSAPDMSQNTAATGGVEAAGPMPAPIRTPDDTPMLTDPTNRPGEPVTAGLALGAGAGPEPDPRLSETRDMKKWLPLISPYLDRPDTPDSVRTLFRYIKSS